MVGVIIRILKDEKQGLCMDTAVLKDIGLNESEIKVYFALLELESSTVGPIVEKAKVPDSKIYSILEKLKEKGLASFVIKNNVRHYQASDPKTLLALIQEKERALREQKQVLTETIIPQIEKRRTLTEDKQEAVVYESYEGLKAAFLSILNSLDRGEEYYVFMLGNILKEKRIIRFFNWFHKQRVQKGIKVKLVTNKKYKEALRKHHYKGMTIRFTSQEVPIGTFLFSGKVMTVVWEERPTAFVIKSRQNFDHYKRFFESVWDTAT